MALDIYSKTPGPVFSLASLADTNEEMGSREKTQPIYMMKYST